MKEKVIKERGINMLETKKENKKMLKEIKGITLIALVITIVLNCSYLAMDRVKKFEKI